MATGSPKLAARPAPPPLGPVGMPRNIPVCVLLFVVTLTRYGRSWVWCAHQDVRRRAATGVGGWLGLAINIAVPFVTVFLIPYEVTQMHEREDEQSPVSAWTGMWNLIPLAGSIVWFVRVQGALNRFWEARAAAA